MKNKNDFFDKLFTQIAIVLFFGSFFWFKAVVDFLFSRSLKSWVQTVDPFSGILIMMIPTAIIVLTPPFIALMIARHFHLREKSDKEKLNAAKKAANLYINTNGSASAQT